MVNLIYGRAGSGKTTKIFDMIREDLAASRTVYLIVPEQETVLFETRAAKEFPPSSSLSLEVVNFKRLANLVARKFGGCSKNYISKTASYLYMHSAQLALKDHFSSIKGDDETVALLMGAVSEIKGSGFSPKKLEETADLLQSDDSEALEGEAKLALAEKLRDLSLIMSVYSELESESGEDADDILPNLSETLKKHDFFTHTNVYFDSFFSLTPIEYEILASIIRQADNVTFSFTYPGRDSQEMQFNFTERCYKTVLSLAARYAGDKITKIPLGDNKRAKFSDVAALEYVWDNAHPPLDCATENVSLTLCRDKYEEAFVVLSKILSLMSSGVRAGEIAVITRNTSSAEGVIDTLFEEAGVPYFLASRADVTMTPELKLIFSALSIVSGGWRPDDVIAAVKTGLFPVTLRDSDAFAKYLTTWQIRGRRRFTSGIWSMNPDGFTGEISESAREELAAVNRVKDAVVTPIETFQSAFDAQPTVKTVCRAVWELLTSLGVYEKCLAYNPSLSAHEREIKNQLPKTVNLILDTLAATLPDTPCDSAKFSRLLRLSCSDVNVGAIPAGLDCVTIGQANALRVSDISHVIILDANEGVFPAAVSDDGFFSDYDKLLLEGADMPLPSGAIEKLEAELLWFYRALTLATDGVHIYASEEAGPVSSGVSRICSLLPNLKARRFSNFTAKELIFDKTTLLDACCLLSGTEREIATAVLDLAGINDKTYVTGTDDMSKEAKISPELASLLFSPSALYLSQSKIDSFVMCRFGYYCNYVLKLKEQKRAEIKALDVGNFIHSILEEFFSSDREEFKDNPDLMASKIDLLVTDYIKENLGDTPPARSVNLFKRLRRSVSEMVRALSAEFERSQFKPVRFELPLSDSISDSPPPLRIPLAGGGEAVIGGIIDRLDVYKEDGKAYVRVVDYKTGVKKFSLNDIRSGLNMQLLIYLFSVWKSPNGDFRRSIADGGEIIPAGAVYFAASPAEIRENGDVDEFEAEKIAANSFTRSGIVTSDIEVLRKMEPDLEGKYIPVKLKKDGTFTSSSSVATLADFGRMFDELSSTVNEIANNMRSGSASAAPIKNRAADPCSWCKMKSVCRQKTT